jgi:hypothetical protein
MTCQQGREVILWHAEDFEVDILRGLAAEPIAHPSADDERAAACGADRGGDLARHLQ